MTGTGLAFGKTFDSPVRLKSFLDALERIGPIEEKLVCKKFPTFDFSTFTPSTVDTNPNDSYELGYDAKGHVRSISIKYGGELRGKMNVCQLDSFKIITYEKMHTFGGAFPDYPIFCVSKQSAFLVYLRQIFKYGERYDVEDIAAIDVLREDLYPMFAMTLVKGIIHKIEHVRYFNGRSTKIENVRVIIVF